MSDTGSYHEHVPVLIVGGGLVGLSQALFLQHQGIPFVLVERHAGTSTLPRARGIHFRSMEMYREIGLEEQILAAGTSPTKQKRFGGLRIGETLVSAQEQEIRGNLRKTVGLDRDLRRLVQPDNLTPSTFCFCPQDVLEPVLLAAARQRGGDLRFSTELISFEQDERGVTATVVEHDSGTTRRIRADYLIAADGAHSPIRKSLGIPVSGNAAIEHYLNIYFLADLDEVVGDRTFSQCQIENAPLRGTFASLDNPGRWIFHLSYDPTKGEKPEDFPPERCLELLHKAIGVPDVAIEIKNIGSWESAVRIADRYRQGKIFLVGDAAHLMPPWGGFGGMTGIADAHNLAWKLAAVLKGKAAPALLTTYEAERRPVACVAGSQAALGSDVYIRYRIPTATNAREMAQYIDPLLVVLGYRYHSSAIINNGQASPSTGSFSLTGEPGTRVPHMWLKRRGETISTLDLVGTSFVLLAKEKAWCEVAREASASMGIDLAAYYVGPTGDLQEAEEKAAQNDEGDALLVRPDGFVAWRSSKGLPAQVETLKQVLKQVLGYLPHSNQAHTASTPENMR